MLLFIAISLIPYLIYIVKLSRCEEWKKVKAKVYDARIVTGIWYNDKKPNKENQYFYYRFKYNGKKYGSTNISLYSKDNQQTKLFISETKVGDIIDIYIDPKDPTNSIAISANDHNGFWLSVKFFASLLISGTILTFYANTL